MVSVVLDNLATGDSPEEIMRGYHLQRSGLKVVQQQPLQRPERLRRALVEYAVQE